MALLLKKGFYCIVNKNSNETTDETYMRGWFVIGQVDQIIANTTSSSDVIKYSTLWNNHRQHNCVYNSDIMDKLTAYEGSMYSVQSKFNH